VLDQFVFPIVGDKFSEPERWIVRRWNENLKVGKGCVLSLNDFVERMCGRLLSNLLLNIDLR